MSVGLLCTPQLLKQGIRAAGWVGLGCGGRADPAGVWLHSNPGDYYRWDTHTHTERRACAHTHTLALVFAAGVSPSSRGFPRSEVITCATILHGELRYHTGHRIDSLSSLYKHGF